MFRINEVLKYEGRLFRVLSLLGEQLVWIDLESPKPFPALILRNDLIQSIEDETLFRAEDPHSELAFKNPKPGSSAQIKRDTNYAFVQETLDKLEYFDRKELTARINEVVSSGKVSKPQLYKLLRRYWQRGQTPNALLPDYKHSGGKEKKRVANGKKLGRPREFMRSGFTLSDH
ncbi:hypothetical protein [Pseudodesulfovibrio piezophilus]|uniref:Transposon Tn7 transposition protein TnsB n=1 Tax=Pseudodesulfovibrio piezophilus (strain DSM 21447 / JCM 15486 / C1TLV30) TaxID=1322246 RepID=M1WVV0_PSEP2